MKTEALRTTKTRLPKTTWADFKQISQPTILASTLSRDSWTNQLSTFSQTPSSTSWWRSWTCWIAFHCQTRCKPVDTLTNTHHHLCINSLLNPTTRRTNFQHCVHLRLHLSHQTCQPTSLRSFRTWTTESSPESAMNPMVVSLAPADFPTSDWEKAKLKTKLKLVKEMKY